jgi:hypothetical protein
MSLENGQYITIHEGTMLNTGPHEDSEYVVAKFDTLVVVLGSRKDGAVPVRIVEDGVTCPEIFYFHQPEISKYA